MKHMEIRRAKSTDLAGINTLLCQVLAVHHKGRPDIFKAGAKKYTDEELLTILSDDSRPIFVAVDGDEVLGYAFCIFRRHEGSNILTDIKTLYIDDLCVDEKSRGRHIGTALYDFVVAFARVAGCYNVTLNVWACNAPAMRFYEKLGLVPQKTELEQIL